jgi:WD40 repeat protein
MFLFRVTVFLMALQCAAPPVRAQRKALAPAFYDTGPFTPGLEGPSSLHVFPLDAPRFILPLPFQLGAFAATPDGDALYATRSSWVQGWREQGLYKIEFGPTRTVKVAGSDGLGSIKALAASRVKIVASMFYPNEAGLRARCGLYELTLSTRDIVQIVPTSDCKDESFWDSISMSPDSRKVAAVREHRLEVIDTETKAVRSLGDGFYAVAWSPNGRWIAALEASGHHTILFDAVTFDKRRTLPATEVIWSLDSRSILVSRIRPLRCLGELGTLELLDIESGRRNTIRSSVCQIYRIVFGLVNVAAP